MSDIIKSIIDIFKDLLPSKDLTTPVWVTRLVVLLLSFSSVLYFMYFLLGDTELGARHGLKKIVDTPSQSVIESTYRRRKIFSAMSRFNSKHTNMYALFMIVPFNSKIQGYDYKNPDNNNRVLITNWFIKKPIDYYTFDLLETKLDWDVEEFRKSTKKLTGCLYETIDKSSATSFRTIFGETFNSTEYGLCPIEDNKGHQVAFMLVFYNMSSDPLLPDQLFFDIDFATLTREIKEIMLAPTNTYIK